MAERITEGIPLMVCADARLRLVHDEHSAIQAAIEMRDVAAGRAFMQANIENARRRMFEGAQSKG